MCLTLFSLSLVAFSGCKKDENTTETKNQNEFETGFYSQLDEEQKNYMERLEYNEASVNDISYDALNYYFIGTGLELYNKTSGVETKGVEYKYPQSVSEEEYGKYYRELTSTTTNQITLEDAVNIRNKDEAMTVEDFLLYSFVKLNKEEGLYTMLLKLTLLYKPFIF